MALIHKHKWEEIGRDKIMAITKGIELERAPGDLVRDLAFGYVRVELKCSGCGLTKFVKG